MSFGIFSPAACAFLLERNFDLQLTVCEIMEILSGRGEWAAVCYTEAKNVKELHRAYEACSSYADRIFMLEPGTILSVDRIDTAPKEDLSAAVLQPTTDRLSAGCRRTVREY